MDGGMYEHPATQTNIATLVERGAMLIEPESGRFASGLVGRGRLPETLTLMGHLRRVLGCEGALSGRKVVISAGGTQEAIDPVRFITNKSSGKQGYALAQAALDAGASHVVLVSAATGLPTPIGATLIPAENAAHMLEEIQTHSSDADALIMAAAVADFRPAEVATQKIKKTDDGEGITLSLTRNPDILLEVNARRGKSGFPRVVVGFAAESQNLLENAQSKLTRKGLDFIVANDISAQDAGFATDTNRVTLLDQDGQHPFDLTSKAHISEIIIEKVAKLLSK
jgi:phosphopantothenoylcysteine decarboxylase/phosphopantothenate--cysteine ligase